MIIIFAGALGRFPIGGHAWTEFHYMLGLEALGHQVYFLEDCGEGSWVYNWESEKVTTDLDYPTRYAMDCLLPHGFGDRWIYRAGDETRGLSIDSFREICAKADLFIVRSIKMPVWREEYDWPRRRIFIDTDPGFTQMNAAKGGEFAETLAHCDLLFTNGQRLGAEDCLIPSLGRPWIKTVFPILLDRWVPSAEEGTHFTAVMQWKSYSEVEYDGQKFGNKDKEFPRYLDLPKQSGQAMRLALTGYDDEDGGLAARGWDVVTGWSETLTMGLYQDFIRGSRAEFGVSKEGYVKMRGGWFSDRSLCYLAAGRPVLVQDTGQDAWLPVGEGVVTFQDPETAIRGVEAINGDYDHHRKAARELAETYFDSNKVLTKLMEDSFA